MPLRHRVRMTVNAPLERCLECLADPARFLGHSRYTYLARRLGDGSCEVVFRWAKLGVERYYTVRLRAATRGGTVEYTPAEGSRYQFRMRFNLEPAPQGGTVVEVEAEMGAGLMASLLGRGDFRAFVEELVEKGIAEMAKKLAGRPPPGRGARVSCRGCVLFDPERGYCYALRSRVDDPSRPPCGGRYFVAASLAPAGEEAG
ncbi:MAG: SRPBCC family protein [Desulfurococcales archaeon]|nr:SRPBCC family protein [Desulfurococcales archaeon]